MVTRQDRATPKRPSSGAATDTLEHLKRGLLAEFDNPDTPARDKAALAREIRIVDAALGARPKMEGNPLDELAARRRQKRTG